VKYHTSITGRSPVCQLILLLLFFNCCNGQSENNAQFLFKPDDKKIRYTGRVDFSDPVHPKFWQPGVYI
jgi:hypothetical protein